MEIFIYSVLVILSILGLACIFKFIVDMIYKKKEHDFYIFTIVPVKNRDNVEFALRSVLWNKSWERVVGKRIILVVEKDDKDGIALCGKLCEEYEAVYMCYPDELAKIVDDPFIKIYDSKSL